MTARKSIWLPLDFLRMAADVQPKMRWNDAEAFGALFAIVQKGFEHRRDRVPGAQLAHWGWVDRSIDTFIDATVAAGFAVKEGELFRLPIVEALLGRRASFAARGAAGGKKAQELRRERADEAHAQADGRPDAQAIAQADGRPIARPNGRPDAQANGRPKARPDARPNASENGPETGGLATALPKGEGGFLSDPSLQPQESQAIPELQSSSRAPVFVALDDCHETSPRAREEGLAALVPVAADGSLPTLKLARAVASVAASEVRTTLLVLRGLEAKSAAELDAMLPPEARTLVRAVYRAGGALELRRHFLDFRADMRMQRGFDWDSPKAESLIAEAFEGKLHVRFRKLLELEVRRKRGETRAPEAPPEPTYHADDDYAPPGAEEAPL